MNILWNISSSQEQINQFEAVGIWETNKAPFGVQVQSINLIKHVT